MGIKYVSVWIVTWKELKNDGNKLKNVPSK